jgi:hypothetical protein
MCAKIVIIQRTTHIRKSSKAQDTKLSVRCVQIRLKLSLPEKTRLNIVLLNVGLRQPDISPGQIDTITNKITRRTLERGGHKNDVRCENVTVTLVKAAERLKANCAVS